MPDKRPIDSTSLLPLFEQKVEKKPFKRAQPIPFSTKNVFALIDGKYKLVSKNKSQQALQLFDIDTDPEEQHDISTANPERVSNMYKIFLKFNQSARHSQQGGDYGDDSFKPVGSWKPLKVK